MHVRCSMRVVRTLAQSQACVRRLGLRRPNGPLRVLVGTRVRVPASCGSGGRRCGARTTLDSTAEGDAHTKPTSGERDSY
jgi:hypothetical protein